MSFRIEHAHRLPDDDARERVRALGEYLSNKHGIGVTWQGPERARVSGRYLVVEIEGTVSLQPGRVCFEGKDPGFLWRGKARDYLSGKLAKYLDAAVPLEALSRR